MGAFADGLENHSIDRSGSTETPHGRMELLRGVVVSLRSTIYKTTHGLREGEDSQTMTMRP